MPTNLDKLSDQLDRLIQEGDELGMSLEVYAGKRAAILAAFPEEDKKAEAAAWLDKLPRFPAAYDGWFSEALALVRQLLPDRLADFRGHFDYPKTRKTLDPENYRIRDALLGLAATRSYDGKEVVGVSAAIPHFGQQLAMLKGAKRRFSSRLFELRQVVQADVFDSELDAAAALAAKSYARAAGAIAGVVLERHLKQVCGDHGVALARRKPGLGDLAQGLRDAGVIEQPDWRFISHLADIRNLCDHAGEREPTADQVRDLLAGTRKVLKTVT